MRVFYVPGGHRVEAAWPLGRLAHLMRTTMGLLRASSVRVLSLNAARLCFKLFHALSNGQRQWVRARAYGPTAPRRAGGSQEFVVVGSLAARFLDCSW